MKQESPSRHSASNSLSITPVSMTGKESPINPPATATAAVVSKPKRVRTGCLTCRERHLKCDEGLPHCQNCRKSNRKCKRGVRLNFIDIDCRRPPYLLPATHDWKVQFQDDSREIASEYRGGLERYAPLEPSPKRRRLTPPAVSYDYGLVTGPVMAHQQMPQQPTYHTYAEATTPMYASTGQQLYEDPSASMTHQMSFHDPGRRSYDPAMMMPEQPEQQLPVLTDREELFYMQVFVEEVGIWMDSMDSAKHFSRLLPFQALRQPMLKHALLACGVRHLTLINPDAYADEHAVNYYNLATQALLKQLQNPDRDTILCATTATVLNVYEVMSEKALQRMNHIAGARALIKECRWDATATGIGAACFWLNVGLEMFSCLHFNWRVAWDPDTWGIDMTMNPQLMGGNEDGWTHKILWILAKITNFRASVPKFQEPSMHAEQMRMHQRHQQWIALKQICDKWESCIPPTMQPLASIMPFASNSKSAFPEIWLIERAPVVARMFYHTAMALLGAVHPMADVNSQVSEEMQNLRLYHSRQICGIVAHVKDRGVASASIRCLAIAGEYVVTRREQEEVLDIFDKIKKETGWRVNFINDVLREKWGWGAQATGGNANGAGLSSFYPGGNPTMPTPTPTRPPSGIVNPMYKNADFGAQNPPYQGSWVPANINAANNQAHMLHGGAGVAPQPNHSPAQLYGFSGIPAM